MGRNAVGVLCDGDSIIISCVPIPVMLCFNPRVVLIRSPSGRSAGNLFGITLTSQLPLSGILIISFGVLCSFPGQKGQVSRNSGIALLSLFCLKSKGFLALSVNIMTHSRVIRFNLNSAMIKNHIIKILGINIYFHRATLSGLYVQVVVVKNPKKDNSSIPVWCSRALVRLRVNGDAVSSIDPNGPSGWIIDDPLEVQPWVKGVFLKKG